MGQLRDNYIIRYKQGIMLSKATEIVEMWKQHFNDLLNGYMEKEREMHGDEKRYRNVGNQRDKDERAPPTKKRILEMIINLKKYEGTSLQDQLASLITQAWRQEKMSVHWGKANMPDM